MVGISEIAASERVVDERIQNAAFLAVVSRDSALADDPLILCVGRSDFIPGFPGGLVRPDETLVEGLRRRVDEEAGIGALIREDVLQPVCSHRVQDGDAVLGTHLYTLAVSGDKFREIHRKMIHYVGENREDMFGPNVVSSRELVKFGFKRLLQAQTPPSFNDEVLSLLAFHGFVGLSELADLHLLKQQAEAQSLSSLDFGRDDGVVEGVFNRFVGLGKRFGFGALEQMVGQHAVAKTQVFEIPFGATEGETSGRFTNAVFCVFYTDSFKPYVGYHGVSAAEREAQYPALLMLNRWNQVAGFVGGGVDDGESFREAVEREVLEEVGFVVPDDAPLTPLCSHVFRKRADGDDWMAVHAFAYPVSQDLMLDIYAKAPMARDFNAENIGVIMPRFEDHGRGRGISATLMAPMETGVAQEIECLCRTTGIYPPGGVAFLEAHGVRRAPRIAYGSVGRLEKV